VLTPPIPVVLPLLMAAILTALNRRIPRGMAFLLAILTSATVACVAIAMLTYTRDEPIIVYWFGGWTPRQGAALGIGFVIDTAGAMLVLIASVLTTASLIFSSRYFDTVGTLFHCLMLIFLGAMNGFAQTGDLFNLFVFFELMSAAAYALCGYKSEEPGPIQGALNFAVTNTVGAFLVLTGIALLYSRTGALNLAQIGRALDGRADALVATAFALVVCGFLVKAAIVPFHFWLADAHAVAPAPVCALFSGVMVELGLYAVVRIYWSVFSGVLAPREVEVRTLLATFGAVTAVSGAAMCYAQRHLKRLLAFSTISHLGILLMGVALLTRQALAGVELYVVGHAMLKGGAFLAAGIVLHRTSTLDEIELAAHPRRLPGVAALLIAAAVGLAGAPPFGIFWGDMMIGGAAHGMRNEWIEWISFTAAAATAGSIFRFTARAFFGWGPRAEAFGAPGSKIRERPDTEAGHRHTPAAMYIAAAGLLALGLLAGLAPRLTGAAEAAAIHIQDREAYADRVLDNLAPYPPSVGDQPLTPGDVARGVGTVALALALAGFTLRSRGVRVFTRVGAPVRRLRELHSGLIPDYVTWVMVGVAVFGAAAVMWLQPY
jgi:multicomponent Na+:H+ antiporter subunit D